MRLSGCAAVLDLMKIVEHVLNRGGSVARTQPLAVNHRVQMLTMPIIEFLRSRSGSTANASIIEIIQTLEMWAVYDVVAILALHSLEMNNVRLICVLAEDGANPGKRTRFPFENEVEKMRWAITVRGRSEPTALE